MLEPVSAAFPVARLRAGLVRLRGELVLGHWPSHLVVGLIAGTMTLITGISFAALVFSGPLSGAIGYGVGLALFSSVVLGLWTSLFGSFPATLAIPQDRLMPIFALMAAEVVQAMPGASSAEAVSTVLAAIAIAALLLGLCFVTLGWFRLGNLVRFIPYPVIGGFLAGSGWLLTRGSFHVMTGQTPSWEHLLAFAEPRVIAEWLPGALLGLGILVAMRRRPHVLVVPSILLGSIALFHLALAVGGIPMEKARAAGWLLQPLPSSGPGDLHGIASLFSALTLPDWKVLLHLSDSFQAFVLTGVFSLLLNTTALELATDRDIDLNRELRVAGSANLLTALGGGFGGFVSMSQTRLSLSLGAKGRLVGLVSAAFCGIVYLAGAGFLAGVPKFVLGGLLFFIGAGFLAEWIVDGWKRLSRSDYAVVVLILAVIGSFGYLQGVAVGVVAAATIFVIRYSRVSTIASLMNGAEHRSNVDRSPNQARVLREQGESIFIVKLQGYVFFGSANHLLATIRERAADPSRLPLRFALIDFRRVTGIDSSAAASLVKIEKLARRTGFRLILSNVSSPVWHRLGNCGLSIEDGNGHPEAVLLFPDRDHGLEWCEDRLLEGEAEAAGAGAHGFTPRPYAPPTLAERIAEDWPVGVSGAIEPLFAYLERLEIPAGETLIRQGDHAAEMYFLDWGRLSVRLELSNGKEIRLRTMRAGAVVGELGLYIGDFRTAHVRAETACVVHRLTFERLHRMEQEAPATASAFHRFMARLLSERLAATNRAMQALLE